MLFNLNINLNEGDYLDFNKFHSFESMHGKKTIRKTRLFFILAMVILAALVILLLGWTTFSVIYAALLLLFTLLYMLFFKKVITRNIKAQIKRLKKIGKLPFDPVSTLEFYEDKMVEITASSRTEQGYAIFERVYIVKERYILLYKSSVSAYILPMSQVKVQLNYEDFVKFLSQKCANIEYY
jgi:Ca2+/Na+ antiporter